MNLNIPGFLFTILLCITIDGVLGGYVYNTEIKGWFKSHRIIANFEGAKKRCLSEGAVLASPTTKPMLKALKDLISFNNYTVRFFIDASAKLNPRNYVNSQGVKLNDMPVPEMYDQLLPQQGDCIAMDAHTMRTVPCANTRLPYICFIEDKNDGSRKRITECGTDDPSYKLSQITGSCYKTHTEPLDWDQANDKCIEEGGHLAIVNDKTEAEIIAHLEDRPRKKYKVAIGLRGDKGANHRWFSIDGIPVEQLFNHWYISQPPNSIDERCGYLVSTNLVDSRCNSKELFVCEITP